MEKIKNYIYIIPSLVFIGIFFLYGFFQGLSQSFGLNKIIGDSFFTLSYYKEVLKSETFISSLIFTSRMAITASILSLIVSTFIIYIVYINIGSKFVKDDKLQKILESPLLVPYLIASYLILIVFMQSGVISKGLMCIGIIDSYSEFPILTNDKKGIGIIMAYVWKTTPFIVMMAIPVLKRIQDKWKDLAYVLNVSKTRFFLEVALPLMAPSLLISFFIILAYMFTSFEVPYMLGVTYPRALAIEAYDIYSRGGLDKRPNLMVINMIISLISITSGAVVYILNRIINKNQGRGW